MTSRRRERGAAAVEVAVAAPLLFLLCFGAVEVARYEHFSILVANAARAGVQYGAQNPVTANDNAGMQTAALTDAQNLPGLAAVATHFCQCSDGSASTCASTDCPYPLHRITWVQVQTSGTFSSLLNFPGVPNTVTVGGNAVMRTAEP